ncbi:MAG: DMT family transporter [Leptolyngbya sp. IPPAS B-1204]|nr:EamA family transporter [Elainella sp. C42_A2020_010]RNJ66509.1 MAG: EamA family transporter [Leptolyngbya sp. IPPAS B-1204]
MKIESAAQVRLGLALVLFSAILWGTTGVFVRALYGMTATNPLSVGFFRLAFAVPVLWFACWLVLKQRMFRVKRHDLLVMLLIGGLLALYQVCYFSAIVQLGVAAATLITLCTAPLGVALLAAVVLQERLTLGVMLAGGCAIAGTILLIGPQSNGATNANRVLGVGLALMSALGYAAMVLCSRRLAGRYHPLQSVTISFTAGALALLPCTLATGWISSYSIQGWMVLLYLGLIPTALAYSLYFRGMRHTPATVASIATLLEPLTSTLLAWWLFGEQLGSLGLIGALLLIGSIGLLCRQR